MTKLQVATSYVIFTIVVLALFYDVVAYVQGGVGATISWVIWQTSKEYPALPFAFGFLCGHLFGGMSLDNGE